MTDSFSRFQLLKTWEARERKKAREYDREQEKEGEKKDEQVLYSGKCSLIHKQNVLAAWIESSAIGLFGSSNFCATPLTFDCENFVKIQSF